MRRSLASVLIGLAPLAWTLGLPVARADVVVGSSTVRVDFNPGQNTGGAVAQIDGVGEVKQQDPASLDNVLTYDRTAAARADSGNVHASAASSLQVALTATGDTLKLTSTASVKGVHTLTGDHATDRGAGGSVIAAGEGYAISFTVSRRSTYVLSGSLDSESSFFFNGAVARIFVQSDPPGTEAELFAGSPDTNTANVRRGPSHLSIHRTGTIEAGAEFDLSLDLSGSSIRSVDLPVSPSIRGGWNVTLDVQPAGPDCDDLRWTKKSGGSFGTDANWDPQRAPMLDTDNAIFDLRANYTVDVGAARTSCRLEVLQGEVTFANADYKVDGLSLGKPSLVVDIGKLVLASGTLTSNSATIGDQHSAGAEVRVAGKNSRWDCLGRLLVGGAEPPGADGKLTVSGGAKLTSAEAIVGGGGFQQGVATIDGSGTSWTTGNVAVGISSAGDVTVSGGAKVSSDEIDIGLGAPNGVSTAVVTGVDTSGTASEWDGTTLNLGPTSAFLTVVGGGVVKVTDVSVDNQLVFVQGVEKIHASRSLFACNSLTVGAGLFQVVDGAQALVVVGAATFGVGGATGPGGLEVIGRDPTTGVVSTFQTDGLLSIGSGDGGTGSLEVSGGATLTCGSDANVGTQGKSVGVALVSGASTWNVQGNAFVGDVGTGIVVLDSSTLHVDGDIVVAANGALQGNGTVLFGGSVFADGFISPGLVELPAIAPLSPPKRPAAPRAKPKPPTSGTLTIQGNLVLGATGVVTAEAAGAQSDQLVVTGTATLGGTLVLQFKNGFAPKAGDQFEVFRVNGAVTGAFASVETRGLAPGAQFDVATTNGAFTATAMNDTVALPTVSVKTSVKKLLEKQAKKTRGVLTFTRKGSTTAPLAVSYSLGGTATNGIDYVLLAGSVTIPAKKKSTKVTVQLVDDAEHEGTETIDVAVVPGDDYTQSLASAARIAIVDND